MNTSALKVLVPLALLMGGVFAITFFSQYKERDATRKAVEEKATIPLRFYSNERYWDPRREASLMNQDFPGYFEQGKEDLHTASFWFENRNPQPVVLNFIRTTCMACSEGRVAAIPPDLSKQILQMTAISMLPHGFVTPLPLGLAIPAAQMDERRGVLPWQHHKFVEPPGTVKYEIPPHDPSDPWVEPWGILQLFFRTGKPQLDAEFTSSFKGAEESFAVEAKFTIKYEVAERFYLDREAIAIGELTDDSPPRTHDLLVYSSTRSPKEMGELSVLLTMVRGVPGDPGPFITAGQPILISEKEYPDLELKLHRRILSAYRIPVTVVVKDGPNKLDIGPVERTISITQGSDTKQVEVRGILRGPVSLSNGLRELNFGTFDYGSPHSASIAIETDRNGIELEVVKELSQPKSVRLELTRQPGIGDRGAYKLTATIPAKEQYGEIKDGVAVLQTKGPNPQKLRIPLRGRGKD